MRVLLTADVSSASAVEDMASARLHLTGMLSCEQDLYVGTDTMPSVLSLHTQEVRLAVMR